MSKASGSIDLKSLKVAGEGASKYITAIDGGGIKIHDSQNQNSNYIQLTSNGMEVYKNSNMCFEASATQLKASLTEAQDVFTVGYGSAIANKTETQILGSASGILDLTTIPFDTNFNLTFTVFFVGYSVTLGQSITFENKTLYSSSGFAWNSIQSESWQQAAGYNGELLPSGSMSLGIGQPTPGEKQINYTITITGTGLTFDYATITAVWEESAAVKDQVFLTFGSREDGISKGLFSSAMGLKVAATGDYSHAEGYHTIASGNYSHASGFGTQAIGDYSYSSGYGTKATIDYQTVFGKYNLEDSDAMFIVGNGTDDSNRSNLMMIGDNYVKIGNSEKSYIELSQSALKMLKGAETLFEIGNYSEEDYEEITDTFTANGTTQSWNTSRVVYATPTTNNFEVYLNNSKTTAWTAAPYIETPPVEGDEEVHGVGQYYQTITLSSIPAQGTTIKFVYNALLESNGRYLSFGYGQNTGAYSVTLGYNTRATGWGSFACGSNTRATGNRAHAEGCMTHASGYGSHAEGCSTWADGTRAHAEGKSSYARGAISHAEGAFTDADGRYAHAQNYRTTASGTAQTVIGINNIEDSFNEYAFIIGNGFDSFEALGNGDYKVLPDDIEDTIPSNALTVDWDGNVVIPNNSAYKSKTTTNYERRLCFISSSNYYYYGYDSYDKSEGRSYFDGNEVYIRSKGAINMTGTIYPSTNIVMPNNVSVRAKTANGNNNYSLIYANASDNIVIGNSSWNDCYIYRVYNSNTGTVSTVPNVRILDNSRLTRTTHANSSMRIKHDIKDIENKELDPHRLYGVEIKQFIYNDDVITDKNDCRYHKEIAGFIAEQLHECYPIAVDINEKGECEAWQAQYIIPPMLKLIQEQHEEIEQLKKEVAELKNR